MTLENTIGAESQRPKIAAEVRAWVIVAVTLVLQGMGAVWWAATLNAEMKALREVVQELKSQIATNYTANDAARDLSGIRSVIGDHEARLRAMELRR
jgi:prophage antirepressor-like protein